MVIFYPPSRDLYSSSGRKYCNNSVKLFWHHNSEHLGLCHRHCQGSASDWSGWWGWGWGSQGVGRIGGWSVSLSDSPLSEIFFKVHTILHDIWGFNTIITRYSRYFTSANLVKNCGFFLKARSGDSQQLAKKHIYYNFLGTYPFQCVCDHLWGVYFDFLCHFHLKIASPIGTFSHR